MSPAEDVSHWDNIFATRGESEVSWFEPKCESSLDLIAAAKLPSDAAIIDIGGGASRLVDFLMDLGYSDLSVLDLSAEGLGVARQRLGARAARVDWIVADAAHWRPPRQYRLWHDRAAFHFLTDAVDQASYMRVAGQAIASGGFAIIATFAPDGPDRCSGLPVARHDAGEILGQMGSAFQLLATRRHDHVTPRGVLQRFQYGLFRKLP
jgi:SAM-dependent methyltransferase